MSDETLRERINREFERESDALERRLQERQIADPELAAMKMPDDSFDDLMRRIAAEQKETESGSVKKEDTASPKKPFHIRKRVLLAVAAAAVLAVAMGVGTTGAKLFVPKVENSSEDGEFNTKMINGDMEEDRDVTEEEAYEEIEERLGIQALRLGYRPEDMILKKVYIDENMGEAQMEFYRGENVLTIYENKQMENAIFDTRIDGEYVGTIETFNDSTVFQIFETNIGEGILYMIQAENGNACYRITSDIDLEQIE